MLGKLIKYNFKSIIKFISIFYILGFVFAISRRVLIYASDSIIIDIIREIFTGATISMLVSIIINNLMRFWVLFKSNLYGDEGYLTHTLPVSKKELYLSKFISSLLVTSLSFLVSVCLLFIAFYSKEFMLQIKDILFGISTILDTNMSLIIIGFIFIIFLEIFSLLLSGYLGIIIGHRFNYRKIGYSVLFGFIVYTVIQLLLVLVMYIVGLFNSDIMHIFTNNQFIDFKIFKVIFIITAIYYVFMMFVNMFVSIKVLKKGVNVD